MSKISTVAAVCLSVTALVLTAQEAQKKKGGGGDRFNSPVGYSDTPVLPDQKWKVHDIDRPRPRVITPASAPGQPPSDAIVLFNGKDTSAWTFRGRGGKQGQWKVENGYMEIVPGQGTAVSKEKFGDAQFHIEWSAPTTPSGNSQWRANSGVLIMGLYEIQVLDSYNNPTYADGQAGSIYGQWPPLVNATAKPGEWNYYDIIFEAPKWEGGKMTKNPYVTVIHNGAVLHHRKKIIGPMAHRVVAPFKEHEAELPLAFQDHDVPVRYRNIWVRKLTGYDKP